MSTHISTSATVGRPRDPEATATILAATLRLLAERGYGGMSTADVAAAARASKATVYRRWPSKFALAAEAIRHALRSANPATPDSGDVRADMIQVLENKIAALSDTPLGGAVRALISHAAEEPELARALADVTDGARERGPLRPLVEKAVREGLLPSETDVHLILDLMLGPIFFQLLVRQSAPDRGLAAALVGQLLPARPNAKEER